MLFFVFTSIGILWVSKNFKKCMQILNETHKYIPIFNASFWYFVHHIPHRPLIWETKNILKTFLKYLQRSINETSSLAAILCDVEAVLKGFYFERQKKIESVLSVCSPVLL